MITHRALKDQKFSCLRGRLGFFQIAASFFRFLPLLNCHPPSPPEALSEDRHANAPPPQLAPLHHRQPADCVLRHHARARRLWLALFAGSSAGASAHAAAAPAYGSIRCHRRNGACLGRRHLSHVADVHAELRPPGPGAGAELASRFGAVPGPLLRGIFPDHHIAGQILPKGQKCLHKIRLRPVFPRTAISYYRLWPGRAGSGAGAEGQTPQKPRGRHRPQCQRPGPPGRRRCRDRPVRSRCTGYFKLRERPDRHHPHHQNPGLGWPRPADHRHRFPPGRSLPATTSIRYGCS